MNIIDELKEKVDQVLLINNKVLALLESPPTKKKISFKDYCLSEDISRPTAYKRAENGLIKIEKVGGKNYVLVDSISVLKKYIRVPA